MVNKRARAQRRCKSIAAKTLKPPWRPCWAWASRGQSQRRPGSKYTVSLLLVHTASSCQRWTGQATCFFLKCSQMPLLSIFRHFACLFQSPNFSYHGFESLFTVSFPFNSSLCQSVRLVSLETLHAPTTYTDSLAQPALGLHRTHSTHLHLIVSTPPCGIASGLELGTWIGSWFDILPILPSRAFSPSAGTLLAPAILRHFHSEQRLARTRQASSSRLRLSMGYNIWPNQLDIP
jgi:hypothetical protein